MLKILLKDAIKVPGKLVALCLVMYLASLSLFAEGFLLLLAARWLHKAMQQKAKAIEAAEAEAEVARVEAEKLAAASRAAEAARATVATASVASAASAANDTIAAAPTSTRRYAKSAVVIPFKTGTL
ncbi:hypothetical protein KNO81_34240 [Paraburkholderia sediminicola]|jgi:hypothetical protein|nr:hypothetical protein [Paraburkholderia sediminicola]